MSRPSSVGTVIVGAGIAGVAVAHALAKRGLTDTVIVDERAPLSLTSAVSSECYRDRWPDGDMVGLMTRSIDLLDELAAESDNVFRMSRRGYLFATADERRIDEWERSSAELALRGAGPVRRHDGRGGTTYLPSRPSGVDRELRGIDLITDRALIEAHFPYLSPKTVAVLHARRCGWLSAQQLGMYLLDRATEAGARPVRGRVDGLEIDQGRIRAVRIDGQRLAAERVVLAAGPYTRDLAALARIELPIECEPHQKVAFHDTLGAIPRDAPFLLWADPQPIPWTDDERRELVRAGETELTTKVIPPAPHGRPEGDGDAVLMLWGITQHPATPSPTRLPEDPRFPEIALRGWSSMVPALRSYFRRLPRPFVDGGWYARTPENRPLIGPLPARGLYVVGALSGFGIMSSCGAADLVARHICGDELPRYAPAFLLERYDDAAYRARIPEMISGQL